MKTQLYTNNHTFPIFDNVRIHSTMEHTFCKEDILNVSYTPHTEYLTEGLLFEFLQSLFPAGEIIHNKKIAELGFRPDYFIPSKKLLIEFDGLFHYTCNKIVLQDIRKNNAAFNMGYSMIRIPYFVQLNKDNIYLFFKDAVNHRINILNDFNSFPDGFIDDRATLPGDFSSIGLQRYYALLSFNGNVLKNKIITSLFYKLLHKKATFFECFPSTQNVTENLQLLYSCNERYNETLDIEEIENDIKNTIPLCILNT